MSTKRCGLASFFNLSELETDYLLALVDRNRAGSESLRQVIERRLSALRERHLEVEHRMPGARTLSHEQRATFYSQWFYSAVRLATALPGGGTPDAIAGRLELPQGLVQSALDFLLAAGLVVRHDAGYRLGLRVAHRRALRV